MDTYQTIQNSIELVQRMSENPKAVLEALDPAGRNRVMTELSLLAERSAGVEDEADLLYVTDALHRLPNETPALAKLLFPRNEEVTSPQERRTTRTITIDDVTVAYDKNLYAQEHAAEIHNHVVRCRKVLEQALLESS